MAAGYARRLDAPLVGRIAEFATIRDQIARGFADNRCGVLTLMGPAGVGKSRLAREVAVSFESSARVVSGRCLAYGAGITYWPLVELVRELGGLDAVADAIRSADDASVALERLRSALGESSLVVPSDELFWGIRRVLEGLARGTTAARLSRGHPLGRADDARPARVHRRVRHRRRSCCSATPARTLLEARPTLGAVPARRARPALRRRDGGAARVARASMTSRSAARSRPAPRGTRSSPSSSPRWCSSRARAGWIVSPCPLRSRR